MTHYVYTIAAEGRVRYVGCTIRPRHRIAAHRSWTRSLRDVRCHVEGPFVKDLALRYENWLIWRYDPERNIASRHAGSPGHPTANERREWLECNVNRVFEVEVIDVAPGLFEEHA